MAKRTTVQLIDDISGEQADRTLRFAFDGVYYEIDLTEANIDSFQRKIQNYLNAARRVGGRHRSAGGTGQSTGTAGESNAIREWAREQGIEVNARGRIPIEVVEKYRAR